MQNPSPICILKITGYCWTFFDKTKELDDVFIHDSYYSSISLPGNAVAYLMPNDIIMPITHMTSFEYRGVQLNINDTGFTYKMPLFCINTLEIVEKFQVVPQYIQDFILAIQNTILTLEHKEEDRMNWFKKMIDLHAQVNLKAPTDISV